MELTVKQTALYDKNVPLYALFYGMYLVTTRPSTGSGRDQLQHIKQYVDEQKEFRSDEWFEMLHSDRIITDLGSGWTNMEEFLSEQLTFEQYFRKYLKCNTREKEKVS